MVCWENEIGMLKSLQNLFGSTLIINAYIELKEVP